jgi:hypothetical protein
MTFLRRLATGGGTLLTALLLLTRYASAQPTLSLLSGGVADPNGLAIGSGGVLYGTTYAGGTVGQVYSLTPPASPDSPWTFTVLHSFGGSDGAAPFSGVTIGAGGVLYGTTTLGGGGGRDGCGTAAPPQAWRSELEECFTNLSVTRCSR